MEATYVYFGHLVHGPGNMFADQYITGLKKGPARILGKGANRLPLVHVTDAARALVHLAGLPRTVLVGRTLIVMDGTDTIQRELLDDTVAFMGVKRPGAVPIWLDVLVAGSIAVETITLIARGQHHKPPEQWSITWKHPHRGEQRVLDRGADLAGVCHTL